MDAIVILEKGEGYKECRLRMSLGSAMFRVTTTVNSDATELVETSICS